MNNIIFLMTMSVLRMISKNKEEKTEESSIFEVILFFIAIIVFAYIMFKITFS